ncbi:lysophospholipid acyltransferase family protein, partial [candidate division KSB1 bacterium]|nr:lysophospholipid acyltransferase family protein [candidate division KSB1 bacterium]
MTQAEQSSDVSVFKFNFTSQNPIAKKFLNLIESPLEKLLAIHKINSIYAENTGTDSPLPHLTFPDQALKFLNISYHVPGNELERIPKEGPVILISNHPFGMIEGIILAAILNSVRSDFKIMANYLLSKIHELKDIFILTDPFERADSPYKNIKAVKEAITCLKNKGMLVIFPAGEVSHLKLNKRQVTDPAWAETVPRLVKITGAPVLPVFFEGKNSTLFQMLGLVHPKLRTAMLPRQLLNKMNKT